MGIDEQNCLKKVLTTHFFWKQSLCAFFVLDILVYLLQALAPYPIWILQTCSFSLQKKKPQGDLDPCRVICSNFDAEAKAIETAFQYITETFEDVNDKCTKNYNLLTL